MDNLIPEESYFSQDDVYVSDIDANAMILYTSGTTGILKE
jgi:acyl-coenzyme A synthetase/AMP-(fatty) acid ligase